MLHSMTGYGRATSNFRNKVIHAEIRTLNSKLTDFKVKLPGDYKEKELEIRKMVLDKASRGKIDMILDIQSADGAINVSLNSGLFKGYYNEITRICTELGIPTGDVVQTIMRIPNVSNTSGGELDEEEWTVIQKVIAEASDNLNIFRIQEGAVLESDINQRVGSILVLLQGVDAFEAERTLRMKERIKSNFADATGLDNFDQNRFEQELLYYLEKMDISEEKVRLEQHCLYFLETLKNDDAVVGRTLSFISQEMGREINTLGAKAYDVNIQKIVVQMKEELEKVKEQLANVL